MASATYGLRFFEYDHDIMTVAENLADAKKQAKELEVKTGYTLDLIYKVMYVR